MNVGPQYIFVSNRHIYICTSIYSYIQYVRIVYTLWVGETSFLPYLVTRVKFHSVHYFRETHEWHQHQHLNHHAQPLIISTQHNIHSREHTGKCTIARAIRISNHNLYSLSPLYIYHVLNTYHWSISSSPFTSLCLWSAVFSQPQPLLNYFRSHYHPIVTYYHRVEAEPNPEYPQTRTHWICLWSTFFWSHKRFCL